jgi:hypothetical protein
MYYYLRGTKNKEILQLDQVTREQINLNIVVITFKRRGLISTTTSL